MKYFTSFVRMNNIFAVDGSLDSCQLAAAAILDCLDLPTRTTRTGGRPSHDVALTREIAVYLYVKDAKLRTSFTPAQENMFLQAKSFLGHIHKMREKGATSLFLTDLNLGRSLLLINSFRGVIR